MQKVLPAVDNTFTVTAPAGKTVTSVSFFIVDAKGAVVQAPSAGSFSGSTVSLVALAATNVLPTFDPAKAPDLRGSSIFEVTYTLNFSDATNLKSSFFYIVEPATGVIVGINSAVTLAEANLICSMAPDLEVFPNADRDTQISALQAAWGDLCQVRFRYYNDDEQSRVTDIVGRFSMELRHLTQAQVLILHEKFLRALGRAQVFQADHRLGANAVEKEQSQGIFSKKVGEASATFRLGMGPIVYPVCKKAMAALWSYTAQNEWKVARG
jgi:hypothetical protein